MEYGCKRSTFWKDRSIKITNVIEEVTKMIIKDGIAYADDYKPLLKVTGVRPLENYKLWLRFNNDEERIFDCSALLMKPAFVPLQNEEVFRSVYIDFGAPVWNDGDIDIAPEHLYENSQPINQ